MSALPVITRTVLAADLLRMRAPRIRSTYWKGPLPLYATREGSRIRVRASGISLLLDPHQRVQVLIEEGGAPC